MFSQNTKDFSLRILIVFGTRPEAIKMAPVIQALSQESGIESQVCVTAQHREMLDQVLDFFQIKPDFDLDIMKPNQSLGDITSIVLHGMSTVFSKFHPDLVLVHGDTSTTFAVSLSAYYHRIPIGHIEAGLRTENLYSPWPEEANRRLTSVLASLHFAPTEQARINLQSENIASEQIHVTGNTVVDALINIAKRFEIEPALNKNISNQFDFILNEARLILITGHRRENFGSGFEQICRAIRRTALEFPDVVFVYPVHLNPHVRAPVQRILAGIKNVFLIEPQAYLSFVWLMKRSYLILTDSGGIQEEAPSLAKPVLVMRETTERPEAINAGSAKLVGTNEENIINEMRRLLCDDEVYAEMANAQNPFGDGRATERIVSVIRNIKKGGGKKLLPAFDTQA